MKFLFSVRDAESIPDSIEKYHDNGKNAVAHPAAHKKSAAVYIQKGIAILDCSAKYRKHDGRNDQLFEIH